MSQLWNVASQVQGALGAQYRPATENIAKETGLEPPVWTLLATALSYEPEPISVTQIQKRNPYTAAPTFEQRFETLKTRGWFDSNAHKEYRLTDAGRAKLQSILQTLRAHHATIQPLPSVEMNRVAELLQRVVAAAENAPTPPGTWCITRARRLKPADSAAPTTKIDHYLACLNAFRDDAHLAAWRAHSISGPAWEAFTLIWRGEAKTVDELFQKLAPRGHAREIYAAVLKQLADKKWVEENAGAYAATAQGKTLREEVEATTDKYFDGAYALSDADSNELRGLLEKLREALTRK